MNEHTFEVAWYRLRGTFARRWTSYLSVILLIGLTGGLAMASVAAARRTQSSYPTYLASTNPSTLTMAVFGAANGGRPGPSIAPEIRRLADVTEVRTLDSGMVVALTPSGAPRLSTVSNALIVGSLDGYDRDQDRLTAVLGRLANPKSVNEIVITPGAAKILGVRVHQSIPLGFYTPSEASLPGFGTANVKPKLTINAKVVGIVLSSTEIVQDDIDGDYGFVYISPILTRKVASIDPDWKTPVYYGIQLRHGDSGVTKVEADLVKLVPSHYTYEFHVASVVTSTVELAVKPESIALGAFGLIAALVCLLLSAQALSRLLRQGGEDRRVLQALGASRSALLFEGLLTAFGTLVLGVILAVAIAIALSPLSPLGPVRAVYPSRGVAFDWTVLGGGAALLLLILASLTTAIALITAPHRMIASDTARRPSTIVRQLQTVGLAIVPSIGVHFALESPRGRDEVPVRSILLGSILAVALMVTTITFASSLDTLVSRPSLYGWNWNYELNATNNVPVSTLSALNHDPDIAAWSGVNYDVISIDGQTVPMLEAPVNAKVAPPILSGHGLRHNDEIVLGNQTMALLHKKVGDTVSISYGSPSSAPLYIPPTKLTIVGTATFPAVGFASTVAEHTSMGTGALVPTGIQPPSFTAAINSKDPNLDGPELVFIRLLPGVGAAAGRLNLQHIAKAANEIYAKDPRAAGNSINVVGALRPAQIVNYRSIGATPVVLATGLAVGAVVALALTLIASVRRRRRDLAVLKTLGFTRRQLAAAVSWQASVDALIGAIIGIPLGIFLGRELWTLFARSINAVPFPTVPALAVTLVGVGTLVVANLAALWPARSAARTSAGLVLRSE